MRHSDLHEFLGRVAPGAALRGLAGEHGRRVAIRAAIVLQVLLGAFLAI